MYIETDQYGLPEQEQHFLHGEMGRIHAAELGYHGEEEEGKGLSVIKGRT